MDDGGDTVSSAYGRPSESEDPHDDPQLKKSDRVTFSYLDVWLYIHLNAATSLGGVIISMAVSFHYAIKSFSLNDGYKEQKEAAKKRLAQMKKDLGLTLDLNEFETILAANVINPEKLEISSDDISGMDALKDEVVRRVIVPMQMTSTYCTTLLKPAKGVLLYGVSSPSPPHPCHLADPPSLPDLKPPGTGKTMLAKAMAKQCGCFFLMITTSTILSKYLGDASRMVKAIFTLADKLQPCIIFIDEVDALMGKRGLNGEHEATLQVKTEFMQHWEGIETTARRRVLVMGATNRPFMIDEAVLRRFSLQYEVPLPNHQQREAILIGYMKRHHKETWTGKTGGVSEALLLNKEVDLADGRRAKSISWIASISEGYSGSDLVELCSAAAQNVLADVFLAEAAWKNSKESQRSAEVGPYFEQREVRVSDFETALKTLKPSSAKANQYRNQLKLQGGDEKAEVAPTVDTEQETRARLALLRREVDTLLRLIEQEEEKLSSARVC